MQTYNQTLDFLFTDLNVTLNAYKALNSVSPKNESRNQINASK